jgi:hypothetical protein
MAVGWAQRPFPGFPVTALAFSPDGDFCAVASAAAKQVGSRLSALLWQTGLVQGIDKLGVYTMVEPDCWVPRLGIAATPVPLTYLHAVLRYVPQLAFYRVVSNSATSSEVALHTLGVSQAGDCLPQPVLLRLSVH